MEFELPFTESDFENFDVIASIGKEIRSILQEDESQSKWMENVLEEYNNTGEFPSNTFTKLRMIIKEWNNMNIFKGFMSITQNSSCQENGELLLTYIFCPPDNEEEEDLNELEEDNDNEFVVPEYQPTVINKVMTMKQLFELEVKKAKEASEFLSLDYDTVFLLLQRFGFNEDNLYSRYAETPKELLAQIGLTQEQAKQSIRMKCKNCKTGECMICFCDYPGDELLALPCNHFCCRDCWKEHVFQKIKGGSHYIPCQAYQCKCRVTLDDVKLLCADENIFDGYYEYILENQISIDPNITHCLNPKCNYILTIASVGRCNVATCLCGQRVCWKCREEAHAPLSCELLKKWRNINDDVVDATWIVENTKPCPKCHSRIEKNGGCNHMTCKTSTGGGCGHEFCWICGNPWKTHVGDGYSCNKYTDFDTINRPDIGKDDYKRLEHYYSRYTNHVKSQKAELVNQPKLHERLVTCFISNKSDSVSIEFAHELADEIFQAINTARSVLVWSYPHAFYMNAGSTDLRLFEYVQKEVERYLEELSYLVENMPNTIYTEFKTNAQILANNTEVLNKHVDHYTK